MLCLQTLGSLWKSKILKIARNLIFVDWQWEIHTQLTNLFCFRADLEERYLEFQAEVPLTRIVADYVMQGKFLVLPIRGKGKCNMNFSKFLEQQSVSVHYDIRTTIYLYSQSTNSLSVMDLPVNKLRLHVLVGRIKWGTAV